MAAKTLADFPISQHRQPRNPEIIQLDSFPTANGVKASITLEEPGLPHDAHLVPADPALRIETIQWLMFQMGDIGAMFGQYGHFGVFAGKDIEDPRPRERDENEAKRLPSVHEQRLEGRRWIMGDDWTIADIATFPWVRGARDFYKAEDAFDMHRAPNVMA